MSYDVSFHPVPHDLLLNQIYPYLLGVEGFEIDELVDLAVHYAKIRFVANAWSIGLRDQGDPRFIPHLHLWGRPFFITVEDPEEIPEWVSRYQGVSSTEEIDSIAEEMLRRLDPSLVGKVEPRAAGHLATDDQMREEFQWKLELVRNGSLGCNGRGPEIVVTPSGDQVAAREVVERFFVHVALEFASHFVPGWYVRGRNWARALHGDANCDAPEYLSGPKHLWMPLLNTFKELNPNMEEGLVEEFVVRDSIPDFRAHLKANREALLSPFSDPEERSDMTLVLQKLDEALCCSQLCGHSFASAQEIYSGPMGILN